MSLERKEKVGGGDNSMEIAEEEARVNHGGPLESRRKTGKLAPEMGKDYVPFDEILNQEKQDSEDVGFSADSQYASGENEVIEAIDEKIKRDRINENRKEQQFNKGRILVWHDKKIRPKKKNKSP